MARENPGLAVRLTTMVYHPRYHLECKQLQVPGTQEWLPRIRRLVAAVDLIDLEGVCSQFYDWLHKPPHSARTRQPQEFRNAYDLANLLCLHAASTLLTTILFPIDLIFIVPGISKSSGRRIILDFLHIMIQSRPPDLLPSLLSRPPHAPPRFAPPSSRAM